MHYSLALALASLAGFTDASSARQTTDLSILAGIHTIFSFQDGAEAPAELLELTRAGLVGGVILFGANIDVDVTPSSMQALQDAYAESPAPALIKELTGVVNAPLFVMTDQEGGFVKRIKDGGPATSAKEVGLSKDPEAAGREAGASAAEALNRYSNNANLAPVMDVYREEGDFLDQFERSYCNTSDVVIQAGVAFLEGSIANGVAASAKHFPGLGSAATEANTDERPVTLDLSKEDLRAVDIPPFAAAVDAGVDMVMASWAIYPAIDPDFPAGLSRKWLHDELRVGLGFKGVIVSDAVGAGAVVPYGDQGQAAVLAAQAGMDLMLSTGANVTFGNLVRDSLESAVTSGDLDRAEFDAATDRIVKLREKLGAA